jgi:DNA-binding NtrC family response regulator
MMLADLTRHLRIDPADLPDEDVIFGSTRAMHEVRRRIDWSVRENLPVLIQGESGTGKEIIAKYLHLRSVPDGQPFVKVNCVALTADFLTAEMRGSHGAGTLFLDEISDMDWLLREELVHSLSSRCRTHIEDQAGGSGARIVCSTRICTELDDFESVSDWAASGKRDLVRLYLPALRERRQDLPQLCEFMMHTQSSRFGKHAHRLTPDTLELLSQWPWPGNLRELENWVARVVILGSQEALAAELRERIALDRVVGSLDEERIPTSSSPPKAPGIPAFAESAIREVLETHRWSRRRVAREFKIGYRALLYELRDAGAPGRRRKHREHPPPMQ